MEKPNTRSQTRRQEEAANRAALSGDNPTPADNAAQSRDLAATKQDEGNRDQDGPKSPKEKLFGDSKGTATLPESTQRAQRAVIGDSRELTPLSEQQTAGMLPPEWATGLERNADNAEQVSNHRRGTERSGSRGSTGRLKRTEWSRSSSRARGEEYGVVLFQDSRKETKTQGDPFSQLRQRLARQKKAMLNDYITIEDYTIISHDILTQAEQYYQEMYSSAEQDSRKGKTRAEENPPTPGRVSERIRVENGAEAESEMVKAAIVESRKQYQRDARRMDPKADENSQRQVGKSEEMIPLGHNPTVRATSNGDNNTDSIPKTSAMDGEFTSGSEDGNAQSNEVVDPWYIPDYPHDPNEQALETEYRGYLTRYRERIVKWLL